MDQEINWLIEFETQNPDIEEAIKRIKPEVNVNRVTISNALVTTIIDVACSREQIPLVVSFFLNRIRNKNSPAMEILAATLEEFGDGAIVNVLVDDPSIANMSDEVFEEAVSMQEKPIIYQCVIEPNGKRLIGWDATEGFDTIKEFENLRKKYGLPETDGSIEQIAHAVSQCPEFSKRAEKEIVSRIEMIDLSPRNWMS